MKKVNFNGSKMTKGSKVSGNVNPLVVAGVVALVGAGCYAVKRMKDERRKTLGEVVEAMEKDFNEFSEECDNNMAAKKAEYDKFSQEVEARMKAHAAEYEKFSQEIKARMGGNEESAETEQDVQEDNE